MFSHTHRHALTRARSQVDYDRVVRSMVILKKGRNGTLQSLSAAFAGKRTATIRDLADVLLGAAKPVPSRLALCLPCCPLCLPLWRLLCACLPCCDTVC